MVGDLREGVRQANDKNALQTVADGCVACKLFFSKSMGIRVNSHANFFWVAPCGPNLRACADLGTEGRGEPREPRARGPRRKWWMLNPFVSALVLVMSMDWVHVALLFTIF